MSDYAGDITPREAWTMLAAPEGRAVLVDVRTRAEWQLVGLPMVEQGMNAPILSEWAHYPDMAMNPNFAASVAQGVQDLGLGKDAPLLFLCRSGVRSRSAAITMTAHGYERCYNIEGGFEGHPNENGHCGTVDGWKADGLPWRQ